MPNSATARRRRSHRPWLRLQPRASGRRILRFAVLVGWGTVAVGVVWLAGTAILLHGEIGQLRSGLTQLRAQVEAGDVSGAKTTAKSLQQHAHRAHLLSSGPAWATAASVPYAGEPFTTIRGAAAAVAELADEALPGLIEATDGLDPKTLRTMDGGFDIAKIATAAPAIHRASVSASRASADVSRLPAHSWLHSSNNARGSLSAQLAQLAGTLQGADRAAQIIPPMLGSTGAQRYFVAFQNDAEARGTGGLPGSFAIVVASAGTVRFTDFEDDGYLGTTPTGIDLGEDFNSAYGYMDSTSLYVNTNVSANFPYAAQTWAAMWQAKTGERVDGAIAVDPTALSYLLKATGPTALPDGTKITAQDVVALTQSTAYARFSNQADRKQFLLSIAKAVSERLLDPSAPSAALVKEAGKAGSERRLLIWTVDPAIEQQLVRSGLSGAILQTPDPYAGFTVNNAGGNKLDYYLDRRMTWTAEGCGGYRTVTASLALTNSAPTSGLPPYVDGRLNGPNFNASPGDNSELVSFYGTSGGNLLSATIDGQPASGANVQRELGHPVYRVGVEIPAGESRVVTFTIREPNNGAPITVLKQPLTRALLVDIHQPRCQ
jgi:hypothetical protein